MRFSGLTLFSFVLIGAVSAQAGFSYKIQTAGLSKEDIRKAQELTQEVEALLPPRMKSQIGKSIPVVFSSKMNSKHMGSASRNEISLNKKLLQSIQTGANKPVALASLIHETAHVYDLMNFHEAEEKNWISRCQQIAYFGNKNEMSLPECALYENMKTTFSHNPYFLELAGWSLSVKGEGKRSQDNGYVLRSVDPYELTNAPEYFAVNMEHFLLDQEYACRRPGLFKLYKNHFNYEPFNDRPCQKKMFYAQPNDQSGQYLKELDPARIYQIHYLVADAGQDLASRWGHAMLRVVYCAPERKEVGPDCLKDISHNLVLSYRAFANSTTVTEWGSLTGKYPSYLFVLPMDQIISEYNKGELRDLKSYPLKLTRNEVTQLAERAIETHWTYQGKYYFMSNNCAVETMNLLKSGLLRSNILINKDITPLGMLPVLAKKNLLEEPDFSRREDRINEGLLMDSYLSRYQMALEIITGKSSATEKEIFSFIDSSPSERKNIYAVKIAALSDRPRKMKLSAAFAVLESAALSRKKAEGYRYVEDYVMKNSKAGRGQKRESLSVAIQKIAQSTAAVSRPVEFLDSKTYGLPLAYEIQSVQEGLKQNIQQYQVDMETVEKESASILPATLQRDLKSIESNLSLFIQGLKGS